MIIVQVQVGYYDPNNPQYAYAPNGPPPANDNPPAYQVQPVVVPI